MPDKLCVVTIGMLVKTDDEDEAIKLVRERLDGHPKIDGVVILRARVRPEDDRPGFIGGN